MEETKKWGARSHSPYLGKLTKNPKLWAPLFLLDMQTPDFIFWMLCLFNYFISWLKMSILKKVILKKLRISKFFFTFIPWCSIVKMNFAFLKFHLLNVYIYIYEVKWSEVAQSYLTLCDPWTAAYQAPPSMGFFR